MKAHVTAIFRKLEVSNRTQAVIALQQMEVELRELMIYQSPPELGSLYTDVEEMMKQLGKEQNILIAQQMKQQGFPMIIVFFKLIHNCFRFAL